MPYVIPDELWDMLEGYVQQGHPSVWELVRTKTVKVDEPLEPEHKGGSRLYVESEDQGVEGQIL